MKNELLDWLGYKIIYIYIIYAREICTGSGIVACSWEYFGIA